MYRRGGGILSKPYLTRTRRRRKEGRKGWRKGRKIACL